MYDSYCESSHYEGGQLKALRFRFVGSNANTWNNGQMNWGRGIFESYAGSTSGQIRVRVAGDPAADYMVQDGQTFEVKASDLGRNRLPVKLSMLIGTGADRARLRISLKCNVDLSVGNIFGVLELVGYTTSADACAVASYRDVPTVGASTGIAATASAGTTGGSAAAIAAICMGVLIVAVLVVGIFRADHSPQVIMLDKSASSMTSDMQVVNPDDLQWDEAREPSRRLAGKRNTHDVEK
jgi:hypothetical protein